MDRNVTQNGTGIRNVQGGKVTIIHNEIIDAGVLTPYELAVYLVLVRHGDNGTQTCYPSHATIAREAHCSLRKVQEVLLGLAVELSLITASPRFKGGSRITDLYTLLPVPEGGVVRRRGVVHHVHRGVQTHVVSEGGGAPRAGGVVQEVQGGGAPRAEELNPVNKTQLNKTGAFLTPCDAPQKNAAVAGHAGAPSSNVVALTEEDLRERRAQGYSQYLRGIIPQRRAERST